MKKVLFILGQVLLFFVLIAVFAAGSFLAPFHMDPFHMQWFLSRPAPATIRYFVPTGLIFMTILYLVVLGVEIALKRVRTAALWTTVVYILALVVGFASKFGFVTTPN